MSDSTRAKALKWLGFYNPSLKVGVISETHNLWALAHVSRKAVFCAVKPKTKFVGYDNNGEPATLKSQNGYPGLKVGFCIGGGPR